MVVFRSYGEPKSSNGRGVFKIYGEAGSQIVFFVSWVLYWLLLFLISFLLVLLLLYCMVFCHSLLVYTCYSQEKDADNTVSNPKAWQVPAKKEKTDADNQRKTQITHTKRRRLLLLPCDCVQGFAHSLSNQTQCVCNSHSSLVTAVDSHAPTWLYFLRIGLLKSSSRQKDGSALFEPPFVFSGNCVVSVKGIHGSEIASPKPQRWHGQQRKSVCDNGTAGLGTGLARTDKETHTAVTVTGGVFLRPGPAAARAFKVESPSLCEGFGSCRPTLCLSAF